MLVEGRLAEAERYLALARDESPEDADLQLHLGVLRFEQGRLVEAEGHLRHALLLEQRDPRPHLVLARVLRRQGRPDEARRHRAMASKLAPGGGRGRRGGEADDR